MSTNMSGSEYISAADEYFLADPPPFYAYLNWGSLAEETWDFVDVDFELAKYDYTWESEDGSTIQSKHSETGDEEKGSASEKFTISSNNSGLKTDLIATSDWSNSSYKEKGSWTQKYTGDPGTEDDYAYKYTWDYRTSTKDAWASGKWTYSETLSYSDASIVYKHSQKKAASWDGEETGIETNAETYSYEDKENSIKLSYSGNITTDFEDASVSIALAKVSYSTAGYTVTTSKFSTTLDLDTFNALPQIGPNAGDFDTITANVQTVSSYFLSGNNVIVIKTADGAEIDAGAGNDKITGGKGNDSITGGAGKDTMTGGGGDDTFYLNFDDYDFTSNKTLLADRITGFKYTGSESDAIVLEGFGTVEAYATIKEAKAAESTANVIYEAKTGKFWYNEDGDAELVGIMNFATVKGIPLTYFDV